MKVEWRVEEVVGRWCPPGEDGVGLPYVTHKPVTQWLDDRSLVLMVLASLRLKRCEDVSYVLIERKLPEGTLDAPEERAGFRREQRELIP